MNNLLKNICLIVFALIGPITLPAGGIQKSFNQYRFPIKSKEIILGSKISLYTFPSIDAKKLMVLDAGTSLTILRKWHGKEKKIWFRVELGTNKILEDPNKINKGWILI